MLTIRANRINGANFTRLSYRIDKGYFRCSGRICMFFLLRKSYWFLELQKFRCRWFARSTEIVSFLNKVKGYDLLTLYKSSGVASFALES